MKRREFITLLGGATVTWPLGVHAQQAKIPRIGIIDNAPIWDHFRHGLRDFGYVEGQSIALEYRVARGEPGQLAAAAAELVRLPVDVIAVFGTPATRAAKQATTTIPIVMISIGDPVRTGLVASLARPGGTSLATPSSARILSPSGCKSLRSCFRSSRAWPFCGIPTTARTSPRSKS